MKTLISIILLALVSLAWPQDNLDYWLSQAATASAPGVSRPASSPAGPSQIARREDALPGVAVLSDGTELPGLIATTRDSDWKVWLVDQQRWRFIPPIAVLSIQAVVVEEEMEQEWRWKEMGSDEKQYTGRQRPRRRFAWKFHLIDDSYVVGEVKGQPLWVVDLAGEKHGPFVLHERQDGQYDQKLAELTYVRYVVISRQAMNAASRQ